MYVIVCRKVYVHVYMRLLLAHANDDRDDHDHYDDDNNNNGIKKREEQQRKQERCTGARARARARASGWRALSHAGALRVVVMLNVTAYARACGASRNLPPSAHKSEGV